jgi:hypothetical protein
LSKDDSWNGSQVIEFNVLNPDLIKKQTLTQYRKYLLFGQDYRDDQDVEPVINSKHAVILPL